MAKGAAITDGRLKVGDQIIEVLLKFELSLLNILECLRNIDYFVLCECHLWWKIITFCLIVTCPYLQWAERNSFLGCKNMGLIAIASQISTATFFIIG